MKTALEIIEETKNLLYPNAGVKALAKMAYDDPDGFCIMDNIMDRHSYREECLDGGLCHHPDFMLACLQTRYNNQLGELAIEIYNKTMDE